MDTNHIPGDAAQMEQRLWDYIDGSAGAEEQTVIAHLVKTDSAWKAKYAALLELQALQQSSELEAPSLRFTKNVMEEIGKLHVTKAATSYINKKIIWGLGFFFIAMLLGFMVYGFAQLSFSGGEESTIGKSLGKVDFSVFFNNTWMNVLLMINVVLGLFLLDNYLNTKRKAFRKEY